MEFTAPLRKMRSSLEEIIQYSLIMGDHEVKMNDLIGQEIQLKFTGNIFCVSCGKQTKKSFGQGFCYPCFINSPDNSDCIVKPELCRGHLNEGRNLEWEKEHHVQPHYVYLALSSDVKVGVTRTTQVPTRWIDQGATEAVIIAETPYRQLAGEIEVALKKYLADKTNWQRMLKNEVASGVDLLERKEAALGMLDENLRRYAHHENKILRMNYPVNRYPLKVKSMNAEKTPQINGRLTGIKGQYLIFDEGNVINVRSNAGYEMILSA
jgi:hypothetical protein